MAEPRALVLGCAGQDGSYLCELLLGKGYSVVGVTQPSTDPGLPNLATVGGRVDVLRVDLVDTPALARALEKFEPDEIYNFASVSFGPDAWAYPARTSELGTVALARLIEEVRRVTPRAGFFQASSAWVFGRPTTAPQHEGTTMAPLEPYGAAKAFGNHLLQAYRERYGLRAVSGIFFNHESPRRPSHFVTRKITLAAARIKLGHQESLALGDLSARRDWGFAGDYVDAAWRSLQADTAMDYVVATGVTHTVEQFVERAFSRVELDWRDHVYRDESFVRPGAGSVADLVGDASRARDELGWSPTMHFEQLVDTMVDADLTRLRLSDEPH
jgi:GDPmannose 4,6-dehydratase